MVYRDIPILDTQERREGYAAFLREELQTQGLAWRLELRGVSGITLISERELACISSARILGYEERRVFVAQLETRTQELERQLKKKGFKRVDGPLRFLQQKPWMSKVITATEEILRELQGLEYYLQ